jgi:hypothetical protein
MEERRIPLRNGWQKEIPDEEWQVYGEVIGEARRRGLRFLLGGAFALAGYTGRWRNTKDLDFFILPDDREPFARMLDDLGFGDYYDELPYERHWIYRAIRGGVIVDLIWAMANRRADVDEEWFAHAPAIEIRGEELHILPPEELVWAKLYVLQKDRTDWTDLVNVLYSVGTEIDGNRLLARIGEDAPLLAALLTVFGWLSPEKARELPAVLRERLHLPPVPSGPPVTENHPRAELLDTRPWFPMEELE